MTRAVGGAGQQVSGVVVEPVEDLDVGAVGQLPVGEVGLPAFVGLGGFEAVIGAAGAFAWLRGDQAVVVQDAPDRRGRGHRQAGLAQVPLQGQRSSVESVGGQLFTQCHDGDDDVVADRAGVAGRAPVIGASTASRPPSSIALEQSVQMLAREARRSGLQR